MIDDKSIKRKIFELFEKAEQRNVFEVRDKRAQSIISLWLIKNDLEKAYKSIETAVSITNSSKYRNNELILSALWEQAVVSYAKIFVSSDDGFSRLDPKLYVKTEPERKMHQELMSIRNSYLAHRGINDFEKSILVAILTNENSKLSFEYTFPTAFKIGHYVRKNKSLINYLKRLEKRVDQQLSEKVAKLDKWLWDGLLNEKIEITSYEDVDSGK